MVLTGKRIVLGIGAGLAAYRLVEIARRLAVAGAVVDTLVADSAAPFVAPSTLQSLTQRPVQVGSSGLGDEAAGPAALGQGADAMLVAPAPAAILARMAQGLADSPLVIAYLACTTPVIVAPAMPASMWQHPATQANVATLRQRGVAVVGPDAEALGEEGLAPGEEILGALRHALGRRGPLRGRRVVVTAGATQEPLDPLRYVAERASGRTGYALAQAAIDLGAEVTLITAPTVLRPPYSARVERVETALEMRDAVLELAAAADILLMAAAVGDYRPAQPASDKIRKEGKQILQAVLERNPDVLLEVARQRMEGFGPVLVAGLTVEMDDLLGRARSKLLAKRLDLIVAYDATAVTVGLGTAVCRATLLSAEGTVEPLPLMSKEGVAERVLERVVTLLGERT